MLSLKAVPMNAMPNGWFGPVARVGIAGESGVPADKNPSGTMQEKFDHKRLAHITELTCDNRIPSYCGGLERLFTEKD